MSKEAIIERNVETNDESLEAAVAAREAEQDAAQASEPANKGTGNKPWATLRHPDGGIFVSIYENTNKDGKTWFKFTVGRTIKVKDEFKTSYSFRFQDTTKLIEVLQQARDLVVKTEFERISAAKERRPDPSVDDHYGKR